MGTKSRRRGALDREVRAQVRRELAGDPHWRSYLASIERKLERLRAVNNGKATVVRHWREGYTVKKHEVSGHWVHRIVEKKR